MSSGKSICFSLLICFRLFQLLSKDSKMTAVLAFTLTSWLITPNIALRTTLYGISRCRMGKAN